MLWSFSESDFEENRGNRKLCYFNPFEFFDPTGSGVRVEDGLDRHFARRLTLAIADFKSALLIPAFLASTRA